MREGIGLQAYGQNDPLVLYKREAHDMFEQLKGNIRNLVARNIFHQQLQFQPGSAPRPAAPAPPEVVETVDQTRTTAANGSDGGTAVAAAPVAAPRQLRLRENRDAPSADGAGTGRAVQGASVTATKIPGRNEPCYCGSGRKFKKCHGALA
jgi:preprotein translocase subunit SecA